MNNDGKTSGSGAAGEPSQGRSFNSGMVIAALVLIAFVVFIVQNTDSTQVTWLLFDSNGPLWVLIVVAAVAGAILSEVLTWVIRRSRRRRK